MAKRFWMTAERKPHTVALMDRVAQHFNVAGGGAFIYGLLEARFGHSPNLFIITDKAELAEVADPGPPPVVSVLLGAESFASFCRGELAPPPAVKAKPAPAPKPEPAPYADFCEPTVEPTVVVSPEATVWTATEERKAVLPPAPAHKAAKHETKSNGKFKTYGANGSKKR